MGGARGPAACRKHRAGEPVRNSRSFHRRRMPAAVGSRSRSATARFGLPFSPRIEDPHPLRAGSVSATVRVDTNSEPDQAVARTAPGRAMPVLAAVARTPTAASVVASTSVGDRCSTQSTPRSRMWRSLAVQGSLQATPDQVLWVLTSHIVTSAIAAPLVGFIALRIGERPVR